MRGFLLFCLSIIVFSFSLLIQNASAEERSYKELQWENLVPASWNPQKAFEGLNMEDIQDGDEKADEIFEKILEEWKKAPVNQQLDGKKIKLAGFIAPLDWEKEGELREFLLVPYFGACIHSPPPPANQILYVYLEKPLEGYTSMDTIWVYGTLKLEKHDSGSMGVSGYMMKPDKIERYEK